MFEDRLIDEQTGREALLQTDMGNNGLIILRANQHILSQNISTINTAISKTNRNLPNNLREAVIHECGHSRAYYGKSLNEIQEMNQELEQIHDEGVSIIAHDDGAECIAEVEVLKARGTTVPKDALDLYNRYTRGK